jgi:hypothetical protein
MRRVVTALRYGLLSAVRERPLETINLALLVMVTLSLFLVLRGAIYPPTPNNSFIDEAAIAFHPPELPAITPKDFSYYQRQLAGKKLFACEAAAPAPRSASQQKNPADDQRVALAEYMLLGIVAGENPVAIIQHRGDESGIHYYVGDVFDGYTVTEIDKSKVVLTRDGEYYDLKL